MGVAIVVKDANFAQEKIGVVTFTEDIDVASITISAPESFVGELLKLSVNYSPLTTNQRGVTWSISSGEEFAEIGDSGILTINENAENSSVTIKATSIYNSSVFDEKTINLSYATSKLNSIEIVCEDVIDGFLAECKLNYNPSKTSSTAVIWSIIDGSQYAQIDSSGNIEIFQTTEDFSNVTIKAQSAIYQDVFATKTISVKYNDAIVFADDLVRQTLLDNGIGSDGKVTLADASSVKSIPNFSGTAIESFEELKYFTGIKNLNGQFVNCSSLKKIKLPSSCTHLGYRYTVFKGCSSLEEIDLSYVVGFGGDSIFENCTSLKNVIGLDHNIVLADPENPSGKSPTDSKNAFLNCSSLTNFDARKFSLYGKENELPVLFENCSSLTSILIDEKITNYTSLSGTKISEIPNVSTITNGKFKSCYNLKGKIYLPKIKTLPTDAFRNDNKIEELRLGSELSSVGNYAFYGGPKVLVLEGTFVINQSNPFNGQTAIYVNDSVVENYKTAYTKFANIIHPLSEYVG